MSHDERLDEYEGKRDFSKSPEPKGAPGSSTDRPVFVIQQHKASSMHFDFRLEHDGVLVSWAVPKGPSLDPEQKRLAVRTEDHPLDYARFEGTIPEDEYGGGAVIVWDSGTYDNVSEKNDEQLSIAEALDAGHVRVRLNGRKLSGVFSLIHARMRGDDANWLLVKERDDGADARRNPVSTEPESIISGLTVDEMEAEMRGE
jgi:DNA ligase D-like protein (predicted 3'-phosphoesterase)